MWLRCRFALLFALLLIFAAIALAQSAQVTGRITDNSGAVAPGVKVQIKNVDTGVVRDTVTNDLGYYTLPQLQPGTYSITAEKQGFRPMTEPKVVLEVDQRATIDFKIEVGALSQEISVTGTAPLLDTVEPSVGQVIDNRQIVELPLNGRDYIQLALLASGTVNPIGNSRDGGFSAGGQRLSANNYLFDGVDNTSIELADAGRSAELVKPSIDAIQEFKVQTNTYSAEYGHGTGAVVNLTIKSGTNAFHGTAFEFIRNEKLDAKNFFASPTAPTPEFRRNQYGFSLGGPVIKNHTFFFVDWEGTNIRQAQSTVSTLPTLSERTGVFPKTITNPLTGQPFGNNTIPLNKIDPVALKLINLYPLPQIAGVASNYLFNGPNDEDDKRFDTRIDHTFGEKDSIFGRVSHYGRTLPAVLNLPPPAFGANGFDGTIDAWNDALGWTHIFSPSLLSSSRVAWSFSRFIRANPAAAGKTNLNQQYGILGGDTTTPGDFSDFTITGYRVLGIGPNNPVRRDSQGRQFVNDTDWLRGSHDIKFGVNILRAQNNILNSRTVVGSYTFNGQYTGDGVGDFLLGWPSQYTASSPVDVNLRGWLLAGYVQDDWKVSPKLTVNLGLRYEISRPWIDSQNRMSNFDMDTNPAHPVLVLAGNPDSSYDGRSLVNTSLNGWEPRLGVAYQITPKTVVRAGFGIFRTYFEPFGDSQFLIGNPPFAYTVTLTGSKTAPAFQLSNGAPAGLLSIQNAAGLQFSSYERNPHRAYAPQWNLNIQRQLPSNWLFEIGYLGERGIHLLNRYDGNFSPAGPGNVNAKRPFQTAAIPGTGIVVPSLGPVYRHLFNGNSNYHALETKLEKRLSAGLTVLNSFTWSKAIGDTCADSADGNALNCGFQNPLNMRAEKALDNQDMRFRYVASVLYQIPLGRGRHWGSTMPRFFDAFIGGWGTGGIFTAHSGMPYSIIVGGNPANSGTVTINDRPNVVGDPFSGPRTLTADFNTAAFVANPLYTYGNLGRNTMTTRGAVNLDFIALKNFTLTERFHLEFRFEAFNATNTPPFGAPNATVGTPTFGSITSAGQPRNLQFGLKLVF